MSLTRQDRDLLHLQPNMRARVEAVLTDIGKAKLPLRLFEGWRSPERQRYLYAQGRTRPGQKVTFARAWESYHQYGLAVDLVGFVNDKWTWDLPAAVWKQMHAIGATHGLERLGFETPHLQLAGLKIGDLMEGDLPEGGRVLAAKLRRCRSTLGWNAAGACAVVGRAGPPGSRGDRAFRRPRLVEDAQTRPDGLAFPVRRPAMAE